MSHPRADNSNWTSDIRFAIHHIDQIVEIHADPTEWSYSEISQAFLNTLRKESDKYKDYQLELIGWVPNEDNWFQIRAVKKAPPSNNIEAIKLLKEEIF